MKELKLPWPPKILSPNSRSHWATKAKAAKKYRADCFFLTKKSGLTVSDADGKINLFIDFHPKTKHKRDIDNCLSSIKNGLDGVADALGVNDNRFILHLNLSENTGDYVILKINIDKT